jgi:hypothetical protein
MAYYGYMLMPKEFTGKQVVANLQCKRSVGHCYQTEFFMLWSRIYNLFLLSWVCMLTACASTPVRLPRFVDNNSIYPWALQGNLKPVLAGFDSLDEAKLTPEQSELRRKYILRFKLGESEPGLPGLAGEVLRLYQDYWRRVLRQDLSMEDGYHYWFDNLAKIAVQRGHKVGPYGDQEAEDLVKYIGDELKKEGYFSQMGRTKPHMDLLLWKKQDLKHYLISLGDSKVDVPVVMMDDFVTFGWLGYATFNYKYTGGWADRTQLHCVQPAYDLNSEKFKVSYLAHEGRHFTDYKRYPKLGAADLEYRAKLTELMLAKTTLKELIKHFANEATADKTSAHAYASYQATTNLAEKLKTALDGKAVEQLTEPDVHKAAADLLAEHSEKLDSLGAQTVTGVYK